MARGDSVTDSYVAIGSGAEVAIQPASGDEWMMMFIGVSSGDVDLKGEDGSSESGPISFPPQGDDSSAHNQLDEGHPADCFKLLLTNSQYISLQENASAGETAMYCAIKTKD